MIERRIEKERERIWRLWRRAIGNHKAQLGERIVREFSS